MPAPPLTERNWAVLGLLRFVLAVSVMHGHIANAAGFQLWQTVFGGFVAVCGFFLISGFSIASSVTANPHHYFKRRLARIYPLYLTAIVFALATVAIAGPGYTVLHNSVSLPSLYGLLCTVFLVNGIIAPIPYILSPLWSLSCEVLYYFAAPLLVHASTWAILIIVTVSITLFSLELSLHDGRFNHCPLTSSGRAVSGLFWVWLLGFLAQRYPGNAWIAIICIAAGAILLSHNRPYDGVMAVPLFIVVAIAVTALPYIRLPQSWVAPANYLGELSYPLYVLHFPVVLLAWRMLAGQSSPAITLFVWMVSLALSIAAYHGIDRRFRTPRRVRAE